MAGSFNQAELDSFNRGEVPGFENIYHERLHFVFLRVLNWVHDAEVAEEISSDCFIRLWERRGRFSSVEKVHAFLYKVSKHASLDYLRKKKPEISVDPELLCDLFQDSGRMFEERDLRENLAVALDRLIAGLSRRAEEIIRLSFFSGLCAREIAELLGIREKTVINIRTRAVKKLKLQLKERPDFARGLRTWGLDLAAGL